MSKVIFICDDDTDILTVCSIILNRNNYQVKTFTEGLKMLDAVEEVTPCCIFLDHSLPDIRSEKIVQILRSREEELKIILFTAETSAKQIARTIGTDDVLEKPFEMVHFLEIAKKYCD